jgi:hypothetical protein
MNVLFGNGYTFEEPETRIRKYCDIEIYEGYDDKHNITDKIEWSDIYAADKLYANIMRFWASAADHLVSSSNIPILLSEIDNVDLGELEGQEWRTMRRRIFQLIKECMEIRGVGLAVTTKVLHLKRPKLFPILDSYVMKFLLDVNIANLQKYRILDLSRTAFERVRQDLRNNKATFDILENGLRDLPNTLERVRMYDILCWSIEKWDIRGETSAPYGIV